MGQHLRVRPRSRLPKRALAGVAVAVVAVGAAVMASHAGTTSDLAATQSSDLVAAQSPVLVPPAAAAVAETTIPPVQSPSVVADPDPAAVSTTTTTAPLELRTPEDPPADPYAAEPEVVLGTIEIPRIGLVADLNQGMSLFTINRGPSHWPGTALPGELGNVVVAGHRVTQTHPFREIDQLVVGDEVIFTVEGNRHVYKVSATDVVAPDAMYIIEQGPEATATLFACHPPGSARYRYVVHLTLDGQGVRPDLS